MQIKLNVGHLLAYNKNGNVLLLRASIPIKGEMANALQVCLDSGAKNVLLPITSAADLGTVPPELMGSFQIIFYSSAEDAVFKVLGVE